MTMSATVVEDGNIEAEEITFCAYSFPYLRRVDRGCKAKRLCPWLTPMDKILSALAFTPIVYLWQLLV